MKTAIRIRIWIAGLAVAPLLAGEAAHPHVETIRRYLAAREAGDVETVRAILADDSRIWFGEREGPGRRRSPEGGGPWSEWDEVFRSTSETLAFRVEGDSVRTTVREINDWYRLVERPASEYHITYWLDADGRIEGTRIHPLDGAPPRADRLDEFEIWARERRPGLLERLMPDGRIDPSQARLWKRSLLDWREERGLGNPLR